MKDVHATIKRIELLSGNLERIEIDTGGEFDEILPGQFVLARPAGRPDPYLREHWIPVSAGEGTLAVERGVDDLYGPGQRVDLLGPGGSAVEILPKARRLLLLAFDHPPTPLLMIADRALAEGCAVTMVLGGAAKAYPLDRLPPEIEVIGGDDDEWLWPDRVATFNWADQVIVAAGGPAPNETYAELWNVVRRLRMEVVPEGYALGFFLPPMPCGVGACGACAVAAPCGYVLACQDGPALDLGKVNLP